MDSKFGGKTVPSPVLQINGAWPEGYNILKFDEQKRPLYDETHIIEKAIKVTPDGTVGVHFTFTVREVKGDWKIADQYMQD